MIDQIINSAVYVVVLSEHMNFPLAISPRKEMADCVSQVQIFDRSEAIIFQLSFFVMFQTRTHREYIDFSV